MIPKCGKGIIIVHSRRNCKYSVHLAGCQQGAAPGAIPLRSIAAGELAVNFEKLRLAKVFTSGNSIIRTIPEKFRIEDEIDCF